MTRALSAGGPGLGHVLRTECDDHDIWQRALLGVSQVGTDEAHVDRCLREVVHFIEELQLAEVGEERLEFLHY